MKKEILFIQGGGDGGYEADEILVNALKKYLENKYQINYPKIKSDETASDYGWIKEIKKYISEMQSEFILIGHSFGASMVLKFLSENKTPQKIKGILLLATPFWSGKEEWKSGLKLKNNFADKLPTQIPIFFYHCKDDEEIPLSQFEQYKIKIDKAIFREIEKGGHQFNNDLYLIAKDILAL